MSYDQKPLKAVHVCTDAEGDEFYAVGKGDITAIEWGTAPGLHCDLHTVRVFKSGVLHSEHPFLNCVGVYYASEA